MTKKIKTIKKAQLKKIDPKKLIKKDAGHYALVTKGETGFFKKEWLKEKKGVVI